MSDTQLTKTQQIAAIVLSGMMPRTDSPMGYTAKFGDKTIDLLTDLSVKFATSLLKATGDEEG